jgi:hypothetical protein
MNREIDFGIRRFRIGDPGIPDHGILLGSGGGFTTRYEDYVLYADGRVRELNYSTHYGSTIPVDHGCTEWLDIHEGTFERFSTLLDKVDFEKIVLPPPSSDMVDYLVVISCDNIQALLWAAGSVDELPAALSKVVYSLREFFMGVSGAQVQTVQSTDMQSRCVTGMGNRTEVIQEMHEAGSSTSVGWWVNAEIFPEAPPFRGCQLMSPGQAAPNPRKVFEGSRDECERFINENCSATRNDRI